jgi:pyrroline-5-carboxylate reductase
MISAFIGGGNMASALLGGLVAKGRPVASFRVVEPHAEARARLAAAYPGIALFEAAGDASIAGADIVVLAVKPQQMRAAAAALAPAIAGDRRPVVLTIAAGIRIGDLARWLGGSPRIVRAMPNTPALIGRGISGVFAPAAVDAAGRALAAAVLEAAGEVVWVDAEERLDAVTAVSGSGPAYVFYFLEALEAAAAAQGFSAADARRLAYATVDGAVALAQRSEHEPAVLRAQVTSKGGTTEAALAVLEAAGVKAAIAAAVDAAARRARELGDTLGRDD